MASVSVRYIVHDVDEAIEFYRQQLGFQEDMHPAPTFAMMSRGDLRLVLSAPGGGPGGAGDARRDACRRRAAGTGSRLRSPIWRTACGGCAATVPGSAMTS